MTPLAVSKTLTTDIQRGTGDDLTGRDADIEA